MRPWEVERLTEEQLNELMAYRQGCQLADWAAHEIAAEEARARS